MPSTLLSRQAILTAKDLGYEDVAVPEWGGTVRIQQMNAEESTAFSTHLNTLTGEKLGMYLLLVFSARDEQGKLIFTAEDVPALKTKNLDVLNMLQHVALRINKMDAASKAVLKKDSGEGVIAAMPTPSPVASAT